MEKAVPKIVNVPALPPEYAGDGSPRLRGLHITDPETIGKGLVAFGVDESEVQNWTIYSGLIDVDAGPTDIMLDVPEISRVVETHARRYNTSNSDMYKKIVGNVIFTEIYRKSPIRSELIEHVVKHSRTRIVEAALIGSIITATSLDKYGMGAAIPVGFTTVLLGTYYDKLSLLMRARYAGAKKLREVKNDNPNLEKQLGEVTLPVYFGG